MSGSGVFGSAASDASSADLATGAFDFGSRPRSSAAGAAGVFNFTRPALTSGHPAGCCAVMRPGLSPLFTLFGACGAAEGAIR